MLVDSTKIKRLGRKDLVFFLWLFLFGAFGRKGYNYNVQKIIKIIKTKAGNEIMEDYEKIVGDVLKAREHFNTLAIGYPTNRGHAFKINQKLLEKFSSVYYNSLVSHHDEIPKIEQMLVKMLANHFNIDDANLFGYVTSGGTEANFSSLWWHRKFLSYTCNETPVLISSKSSHYSIDKIAEQLGIQSIKVNPDDNNDQMDLNHLEELLKNTNSPVIISANLGYTVKGGIDNIAEIHKLLNKYKAGEYKLHIDGAIYGIVAPFLPQFKDVNSIFDIVDSLSFSGHKLLGTYNITGVALTKKDYLDEAFYHLNTMKDVQYLKHDEFRDATFSGSRQSEFAVELFMLLNEAFKLTNVNGRLTALEETWESCLKNADWFVLEVQKIVPLDAQKDLIHIKGQLSVVLPLPKDETLQNELYKKYELMHISQNQCGTYIFPRVTKEILNIFLADYKKAWGG